MEILKRQRGDTECRASTEREREYEKDEIHRGGQDTEQQPPTQRHLH